MKYFKTIVVLLLCCSLLISCLGCNRETEKNTLYTPDASDDGLSGVGTIRGNTNGNIIGAGGRAVCDGERIFAVNYDSDKGYCIVEQQIKDGSEHELLRLDAAYTVGVTDLNLLGDKLYFLKGTDGEYEVIEYDLSTQTTKVLYQSQTHLFDMHAVYGKLLFSTREGNTVILDADDPESFVQEDDFRIMGAMGGLLYGERPSDQKLVAINAFGEVTAEFDADYTCAIPALGKIVCMDNLYRMPENEPEAIDYSTKITILDADNGEIVTTFPIPDIACESYLNLSENYLYVQEYLIDGAGSIHRINWTGEDFSMFDDRCFRSGISLWNDQPLTDSLNCDPLLNNLP